MFVNTNVLCVVFTSKGAADDATDVAVGLTTLTLDFSEDMQAGSGNVVIYRSDNSVIQTIAAVSVGYLANTTTITCNPLQEDTSYYVQIDSGATEKVMSESTLSGVMDITDGSRYLGMH